MNNYSLNVNDFKTFILSYSVECEQIVVNLASKENYVIPYTVENEKKVLEIMKEQILNSKEFKMKQEKKFSQSWKCLIFSASMFVFTIVTLGNSVRPIVSVVCANWFLIDMALRVYMMLKSKINIKDINKNMLFLNNEIILNEKVKENSNILANTNEKTKDVIASIPVGKPVFTLNSIDKIKYEELKQILENIEREEKFDFDYSSVTDEKKLVLNRKLKK